MKYTIFILLFIISNTALIAQNTITISASDFNISGSGIDTSYNLNSTKISLKAIQTWTNAPVNDEFWYSGTLYFDLTDIEFIDSVELDYLHTCYMCFDITFYKSNGDSIFFDNPPYDSVYLYNDSIQLSSLKIWGLEAGFRKLTIYKGTSALKIDKNDINTIKAYPNPTNDHITIDCGNYSTLTGYTLKIKNSLGQTMFTTPINQQSSSVDLNGWKGNGIYFVHLIDSKNNTIYIKKIVLQ